ncbi:MAG TPA: hypothetical protein PKL09_01475 [bacterium]|nr:hypothetical protein [bacterium]HNS33657.1 hypothetical protein [bacterium]
MRKLLTYSVVVATIVWSLGLAAVVPLATAAYSPSAGDKIKTANNPAVYYIDSEGKRHLFSNEVTYWTWYSGTWANQGIKTISQDDFDNLGIGNNVTARPGVSLIKFENSPKAYAVTPGAIIRHLEDEAAAKALYGDNWLKKIITIQNAFETNYVKGDALTASSDMPDGSLVKYEGSEDIYYIEDGEKRLVTDDAFVANNFKDSAVVTIPTTMTFDTGSSITGEEAAITTVAGPESSTPTVPSGTSLSASLASDTPASGLAIQSAIRVPFTTVNLTASADGDITIDTLTVERKGAAIDANFASVALIDADTNVQIGLNQTLNSSSKAVFSNDIVVKAGTTKKIILAGNMAATAIAGQIPQLALSAMELKGGASVVGSLPIVGNYQTVTQLTIGQVTVQRGTYQNATNTALKVGTEDYIISSYKLSANSTEGQRIKQIKYYQSGTASWDSDLDNYQLLADNSDKINATFTVDGKYLTADFSNNSVLVEKGKNKEFVLKADIVGGSTRTVKLGIYRTTDVVAYGDTFGYANTPTYTGTSANISTYPVITNDELTISSGALRIESSTAVAAKDVAYADAQELGSFNFVVQGEPVNITALTLAVSSTTAGSDTFDNIKLVDKNGSALWGPSSPSSGSVAYTSNVQLPVGDNIIKVVADIESTGGFAVNETFYFSITGSTITATGANTNETVTASPSTAVSGQTMTFKDAKLTVTANAVPADGNVVLGAKNALYGSWVLGTSGSGSDVRITAISIGNNAGTTTNLDNLKLVDVATGSTIDTSHNGDGYSGTTTWTLTTPIVMTKNSTKTIELRADVRTTAGAYATHVDEFIITSITATEVGTGNTVTPTGSGYNVDDGADITITGAGTLTVNTSASAPSSRLVAAGQTYEIGRIKLTASNEQINVTDLSICLADGALSGTADGNEDDITTIMVYDSANMSTPIINSPMNSVCEAFALQTALAVPKDSTSGKELVIKAVMANIGTGYPGTANADIKVGIGGTDGIRGVGAGSGLVASETVTANTSSAMILHMAYPSVTINTPATKLVSGAALYDFTVSNPTTESIAIYRLSFHISTSSGDTDVTSGGLDAKRSDWSSFKKVAADSAGTVSDGTSDRYFSFALWNPDSTSETEKELRLGAGQSAQFRFIGRTVVGLDGTTGESIEVRLLGDTASTTGNVSNIASAFSSLNQGNFVWSDLNSDEGPNATNTAQWYNGYLVDGLQSTSSISSIPE